MISHRKHLLRRTEWIAVAFATIDLLLAYAVRVGHLTPGQVESKLIWILGVSIYVAAIWLGLFQEYAAVLYGPTSPQATDTKLSFKDIVFLHSWCPVWIKGAYALAAVILVYVATHIGGVRWSSHLPFRQSDALGYLLLCSAFTLAALPTIASGSRMPGTFAQRLALGVRDQGVV